jgi:hypothetical protein
VKVTGDAGRPRQRGHRAQPAGEIVGENPFALFGGVGAVWIKTKQAAGVIRVTAKHPALGSKTVEILVKAFLPTATL